MFGTTEHSVMTEHNATPDYPLDATLDVREPGQLKALAEPTRARILSLLSERAATTKQLADALERPPGTIGHHVRVLAEAGLIRVVRTGRVRAITEKYYGRTAATFVIDHDAGGDPSWMLRRALADAAWAEDAPPHGGGSTLRYARIPADRADEWMARLGDLADEFVAQPREGGTIHGFVAAVFPTAWRNLPPTAGEGGTTASSPDDAGDRQ